MLIKNCIVCDKNRIIPSDVRIENEVITAVAEDLMPVENEKVIDASGKYLLPAMIDLNIRVKNDLLTQKNIRGLSENCLKGGVTSVALMPNSEPSIDTVEVVEYVLFNTGGKEQITIYPVCQGIRDDKTLSNISILIKSGCVGIFARSSFKGNLLRRIFEYSTMWKVPIFCRGEDLSLSGNGVMNEGYLSAKLGLPGIPAIAETKEVAKLCEISYSTDAPLVIQTVSSDRSIQIINKAKAEGANVYCELSINHLVLTEGACKDYNTYAKIKPPLKSNQTKQKLQNALKSGSIDFLTSAHAAKSVTRKDQAFEEADFGIDNIRDYFSLCYTHLVDKEIISLSRLSELTSYNQAKLLGIESKKGLVEAGYDADLILVDPGHEYVVGQENTPYHRHTLKGRVCQTYKKGALTE